MMDRPDREAQIRSRRALFARGPLSREDALFIRQSRSGLGWFGRPSRGRFALGVAAWLYWFVVLCLGLTRHHGVGRLIIPFLFVVVGGLVALFNWWTEKRVRRALEMNDDLGSEG